MPAEGVPIIVEPFSLLLPVYGGDRPDHLARAYRSSVDEQTLRPAEVVIVQDGPVSDALTAKLAELTADPAVPTRVVVLIDNVGLAHALERGLDECEFDLVARMDADDISLPTRFERQVQRMSEGFDLVGTGMHEFVDENGAMVGRRVPPTDSATIIRYARFHDPFNHPTVIYRRSAVQRAGGYLPMGLMEDYFLFARMIQSGARVANLSDPLVMYRVGEGAYARRGGWHQLRAELRLQRNFRRARFTTVPQAFRNVAIRGVYRLIPEGVRRRAYRRLIARSPLARRA